MPVVRSAFRPAWWLPGPHLQTLWPTFFRTRPTLEMSIERLELPDGDFVDLAWTGPTGGRLVVMLHGLEGSLRSHYARGLLRSLVSAGYRCCFVHFRGCSGEPNRLARSYHSGDTGDLHNIVVQLTARYGRPPYAVIGFSLGGNVLLKWLGELGRQAEIQRAVAVSVPFVLGDAARRLRQGTSRIYQRHLIGRLKQKYKEKFAVITSPLTVDVDELTSFHEFDDRITAPLHGFAGVDDYYERSSSRQFLPQIAVPTLILHARDDPFMYPNTVPTAAELPENVRLELADRGGHVGFIAGPVPGKARYWLDERILRWFREHVPAPLRRVP